MIDRIGCRFQDLVGARTKEIETEDHLLKIADREEGRLQQEIKRIQKEMEELKEQKNIYQVCIHNAELELSHRNQNLYEYIEAH